MSRMVLGFTAAAAIWTFGSLGVQGAEDWRNLYLDATPVLDVRYRYEHVDQDGIRKDANANTLRTRAGFETGRFYGFGVGFDVEWVEAIGNEKFNNTINGKTQYPVVADPDDEQINQLYIVSENTIPDTRLKLGRQRIIWDNALHRQCRLPSERADLRCLSRRGHGHSRYDAGVCVS